MSNQFGFPEASRPYSPNDDPRANELIAADRDFNSEQDALAWLGGVIDYDTFCQSRELNFMPLEAVVSLSKRRPLSKIPSGFPSFSSNSLPFLFAFVIMAVIHFR